MPEPTKEELKEQARLGLANALGELKTAIDKLNDKYKKTPPAKGSYCETVVNTIRELSNAFQEIFPKGELSKWGAAKHALSLPGKLKKLDEKKCVPKIVDQATHEYTEVFYCFIKGWLQTAKNPQHLIETAASQGFNPAQMLTDLQDNIVSSPFSQEAQKQLIQAITLIISLVTDTKFDESELESKSPSEQIKYLFEQDKKHDAAMAQLIKVTEQLKYLPETILVKQKIMPEPSSFGVTFYLEEMKIQAEIRIQQKESITLLNNQKKNILSKLNDIKQTTFQAKIAEFQTAILNISSQIAIDDAPLAELESHITQAANTNLSPEERRIALGKVNNQSDEVINLLETQWIPTLISKKEQLHSILTEAKNILSELPESIQNELISTVKKDYDTHTAKFEQKIQELTNRKIAITTQLNQLFSQIGHKGNTRSYKQFSLKEFDDKIKSYEENIELLEKKLAALKKLKKPKKKNTPTKEELLVLEDIFKYIKEIKDIPSDNIAALSKHYDNLKKFEPDLPADSQKQRSTRLSMKVVKNRFSSPFSSKHSTTEDKQSETRKSKIDGVNRTSETPKDLEITESDLVNNSNIKDYEIHKKYFFEAIQNITSQNILNLIQNNLINYQSETKNNISFIRSLRPLAAKFIILNKGYEEFEKQIEQVNTLLSGLRQEYTSSKSLETLIKIFQESVMRASDDNLLSQINKLIINIDSSHKGIQKLRQDTNKLEDRDEKFILLSQINDITRAFEDLQSSAEGQRKELMGLVTLIKSSKHVIAKEIFGNKISSIETSISQISQQTEAIKKLRTKFKNEDKRASINMSIAISQTEYSIDKQYNQFEKEINKLIRDIKFLKKINKEMDYTQEIPKLMEALKKLKGAIEEHQAAIQIKLKDLRIYEKFWDDSQKDPSWKIRLLRNYIITHNPKALEKITKRIKIAELHSIFEAIAHHKSDENPEIYQAENLLKAQHEIYDAYYKKQGPITLEQLKSADIKRKVIAFFAAICFPPFSLFTLFWTIPWIRESRNSVLFERIASNEELAANSQIRSLYKTLLPSANIIEAADARDPLLNKQHELHKARFEIPDQPQKIRLLMPTLQAIRYDKVAAVRTQSLTESAKTDLANEIAASKKESLETVTAYKHSFKP